MFDQVILVNAQDQKMGECDKLLAHQKGLCHRAFSIFVVSDQPPRHVLLHKRHPKKYHSGSLWTNACCSHPQPNVSMETCLIQRLQYEMGIHCKTFEKIGTHHYQHTFANGLIEHEFDHIYLCQIPRNSKIQPNPQEVESFIWLPPQDITVWLQEHPQQFSPWFPQLWPSVLPKVAALPYAPQLPH